MTDSTNETEKINSTANSNLLKVGQINVETAEEVSNIYFQANNGMIKPAEVLMNMILPIVSNRLKKHFENRKLKVISSANSDLD